MITKEDDNRNHLLPIETVSSQKLGGAGEEALSRNMAINPATLSDIQKSHKDLKRLRKHLSGGGTNGRTPSKQFSL